MSEPHQRTRSGKLRYGFKQQSKISSMHKDSEQKVVYIGISNATEIIKTDSDDEVLFYYQSPGSLSDYHCEILKQVYSAFDITDDNAIDRDFRCTWNIGAWCIDNKLSISFNIMQPNITSFWATIDKINKETVKNIAKLYSNINLQNASCRVIEKTQNTSVQIQGRWGPHLINDLLQEGYASKENITISNIVIGQSTLFCWLVLSNKSKFLCYLTKASINILKRYIPENIKDIDETSSKGGISFKVKNSIDDASQLNISESGNLHYQGKYASIYLLYNAIYIAIEKLIKSIHVTSFIESLEYKIIDE